MVERIRLNPVSPAFFDLTQDIISEIPYEIIKEWNESDKTESYAKKILDKTKVKGTLVSSDSAGLSKLSRKRELFEVLALLNESKEMVFGTGTNIGGRGVGVWAADNTQMFYPETVPAQKVVEAMIYAQNKLKNSTVQIGIGAHYGEFYELGGGMYGDEANFVEEFAENQTSGGEIAISESVLELIEDKSAFEFSHRADIDGGFKKVFSVVRGPLTKHVEKSESIYPIPYSKEFYDDLLILQNAWDMKHLENMNEKYLQIKTVALLERERTTHETTEIALLDGLSLIALAKTFAVELLAKNHGVEIKTSDNLGIYAFDDEKDAVVFAHDIRDQLSEQQIGCRIGIDSGPVAVFNLPNGGRDIAGSPVNIASKMAQDFGQMGNIYLTQEVYEKVKPVGFRPVEIEVSNIRIESYEG